MRHAQQSQGVSERRACRVLGQVRSTQQYRPKVPGDETPLVKRLSAILSPDNRARRLSLFPSGCSRHRLKSHLR